MWAKEGPEIWGLGHVFEGKLYFNKDVVDDNFVPRNRKPKPIPKPEAKPALKPAPKGKHVQLCKMRCKVGKAGFYSTAPDAPDTGGSPAPDPLRRLPPPPPPPPSLEIGWKVPDNGRRRRPKQILLE